MYYYIGWDDNLKIIGHYPQVKLRDDYNPRLPNSYWQVHPNEFPNFKPNLELELHKKAKPTDVLYTSIATNSFGLIVNKKLKTLLERFNLPPHRFYPIKVYHEGDLLEYYWFHYFLDIWKYVDIEKSSAQIIKKFEPEAEVEKIIPIPNLNQIKEFKKSLDFEQKLMLNKMYFRPNYPCFDVIEIVGVQFMPRLFSEKLVTALKEHNITGFEYNFFDRIICN